MTALKKCVLEGVERLSLGPHPDRARLDVEALLLRVLGKDKAWLMTHSEEELTEAQANRYEGLLQRRFQGEPMQYITGETEFYGLPFFVTPGVLIPRPDTEHLVEKVLALAGGFAQPRILDVGTGSGAIAVALASKLVQASITAVDLSQAALAVASNNAERNRVADRIRFLCGDLLAPVAKEACFEIVVSNPPYVPEVDRESLSVEVRDHEPEMALFAGNDGLAIYRRLIPAAHAVLVQGGFLALEIGYGQQAAIQILLAESGFDQIEFILDLQGIPRVACARRIS